MAFSVLANCHGALCLSGISGLPKAYAGDVSSEREESRRPSAIRGTFSVWLLETSKVCSGCKKDHLPLTSCWLSPLPAVPQSEDGVRGIQVHSTDSVSQVLPSGILLIHMQTKQGFQDEFFTITIVATIAGEFTPVPRHCVCT